MTVYVVFEDCGAWCGVYTTPEKAWLAAQQHATKLGRELPSRGTFDETVRTALEADVDGWYIVECELDGGEQ